MTDVYSVIRVLFSRHGTPSAGPATAYSFNDPSGMCPDCDGLGRTVRPDWDRILDPDRSLADGAVRFPPFAAGTWQGQAYTNSADLDPDKPVGRFTAAEREFLMRGRPGSKVTVNGSGGTWTTEYEGLADRFERLYLKRDLSAMSQKTRDLVAGVPGGGHLPGLRRSPAQRGGARDPDRRPVHRRLRTHAGHRPDRRTEGDRRPGGRDRSPGRPSPRWSVSRRSGSATSASTGRRPRSPAARGSG